MPEIYKVNGKEFIPFIKASEIAEATSRLAARINSDYAGKTPVFMLVLKGSIFFGADLLRLINLDCELVTISAKSYGSRMQSSGEVNLGLFDENIEDKDVIIIEDIIDSGLTLKKIYQSLETQMPASIEIVTLLSKPQMKKTDIRVKYVGMEIEPKFVIGYGLDYAEKGRQLPAIYVLDE